VGVMEEAFDASARFPGVPHFHFCWDVYARVWTHPRPRTATFGGEADYRRYGDLLRLAREVWVPSACTGRRVAQWYGLADWHMILSCAPWWDHVNVRDDGYALCTLRHLPDPWDTVFEECCGEAGIPFRRTDHELSYEEYQDVVAGCRFLVNHYFEASTGGLTQLEAYRLGKPVLASSSEWNGSRDYLGDRATYFKWGDREAFKRALREMYDNPPKVATDHCEWVEANFSDRRMVEDVVRRIEASGVGR
jgi:hypothetical protein